MPTQKPPEFIVGPFTESRDVIEGRVIPRLTARQNDDGSIELIVDHRFSGTFEIHQAYRVAWLIANAMAVGAGYACLRSETKEQPFAPQIIQLGEIPTQ